MLGRLLLRRITHPNIRMLAGPGTGKTGTIIKRVLHLLNRGANPAEIFVITFTRAACQELRDVDRDDRSAPIKRIQGVEVNPPILTVLVFFHREGHLAHAALRSVLLAVREAGRRGLGCRITAVIDRGDQATRDQVHRFREHLHALHEIDHGDLSRARNHGIALVDTKYFALLDGDDLFDADWLWKGVGLLESIGDDRTVAHAEVRLSFGCERYGRIQIATDDPRFHPLLLISSWHYAADVIASAALFQKLPFEPFRKEHNLGSEDWLWTCESIVEGIRHVIVPETAYFYRRQAGNVSLGSLRGYTFGRTRLLEREAVAALNASRPSAAIRFADRSESPMADQERWDRMPEWLEAALAKACDAELELHDLHRHRHSFPLETPYFHPGACHLYLCLMSQFRGGLPQAVFVCDQLTPDNLGRIDEFLWAVRKGPVPALNVLVITLAEPTHASHAVPWTGLAGDGTDAEGQGLRLRHVDLGASGVYRRLWPPVQQSLLVRYFIQTRPGLVVNLDSRIFDELIAGFGPAVAADGTRSIRLCHAKDACGDGRDILEDWRSLVHAEGNYSLALCRTGRVAEALDRFFASSGAVHACAGPDAGPRGQAAPGATLGAWLDGRWPTKGTAGEIFPGSRAGVDPGPPDVTLAVLSRSEGYFLNPMLHMLAGTVSRAAEQGLSVEVILVALRPGPRTSRILADLPRWWPGMQVILAEDDDEGSALNAGIAAARGQYLAVLPAREPVSEGWLVRALGRCQEAGEGTIVHPREQVECGSDCRLGSQLDMEDPDCDLARLAFQETWTLHALASRSLFQRFPYRRMPAGSGYGFAGWHWNCETVSGGCRHLTVPDTAVFRRHPRVSGETVQTLGRDGCLALPPSDFFTSHDWLTAEGPQTGKAAESLPADWDDEAYMLANPDVAAAVKAGVFRCGHEHYCRHGQGEGRLLSTRPPRDWDDPAYLRANPDVAHAVGQGDFASGHDHYQQHGRNENRSPAWRDAGGKAEGRLDGQPPSWLEEDLRRLAEIEPEWGAARPFASIPLPSGPLRSASAYRACRRILEGARPSHIILAPALRKGGAERAMELSVHAILEDPASRILLITTESPENRWGERLPSRCTWLPLPSGRPEERAEVLLRLLLNSGARTLHLFFSHLGWEVLRRHAPSLADRMRVFVSMYFVPPVESGLSPGYAPHLGGLTPHLAGILTDNQRVVATLRDACGVPEENVIVLRHPVAATTRFTGPGPKSDQVLWASRLDMDKRPDLLRAIAEQLPFLRFHVYGSPVLDDETELKRLQERPNIQYHGPYDGFDAIPTVPYLCFLYTSRWDGMPNVVLEAMQSGLLVVASDVGGISERLNAETGLLVSAVDDPSAYAAAIRKVWEDPSAWTDVARRGQERIASGHAWTAFMETLRAVPGYLS